MVCCSVLQSADAEYSVLHSMLYSVAVCAGGLAEFVAVCCNVLQCVAACCTLCCIVLQCAQDDGLQSVLQCVAVCWRVLHCAIACCTRCCNVSQCIALCCTMLHCVALCCTVLHCVALCYSVLHTLLQYIAVCTGWPVEYRRLLHSIAVCAGKREGKRERAGVCACVWGTARRLCCSVL